MKPNLLLCLALVLSGGWFADICPAAIIHPKAPEGGKQMVAKWLDPKLVKLLGITNIEDVTVAGPFAEYVAGDLVSGKFLSDAHPGGWLYLLMQGTNAVGNVALSANEKLKPGSLGKSPFDNPVLEAVRITEQLPQVGKQDYELRCLNVAPLFFSAIWLHSESNDLIIPLPDRWKRWNAYRPFSEGEIVGILKPMMEKEKAAWAKLYPPRPEDNDVYLKAMMDYEKAHGGKCGSISFYGISGPFQRVSPRVEIFTLRGMSSEGGALNYKVRVTYADFFNDAKKVEILEEMTQPRSAN